VVALRYPNSQISVIPAGSDSRIKEVLSVARGLLADIQRSPYRDRIFVVLDSVHGSGVSEQIAQMGVLKENIVKWSQNGIEYFYPPLIIDKIFGSGPELVITGDNVSRNGVNYRKAALAEKVVGVLEANTPMHAEFCERLLKRIEDVL
jgi:hypothetical protein